MQFPDKYWHCTVTPRQAKESYTLNDLPFSRLKQLIIDPWRNNRPFTVDGFLVRKHEEVESIQISHTEFSQKHYADRHNAEMQANGIMDFATNYRLLPFSCGDDYTFELLLESGDENKAEIKSDDSPRAEDSKKHSEHVTPTTTTKDKIIMAFSQHPVGAWLIIIVTSLLALSTIAVNISQISPIEWFSGERSKVEFPNIPGDTGWVFLGYYDENLDLYTRGPHYTVVQSNHKEPSPIPREGDRIKLTVNRNVVIPHFELSGTQNKYDSPITLSEISSKHLTGVIARKGVVADVRDVDLGKTPGNPWAVWVRISDTQ